MAHKHQIYSSNPKTKRKAKRSWRRSAKQALCWSKKKKEKQKHQSVLRILPQGETVVIQQKRTQRKKGVLKGGLDL